MSSSIATQTRTLWIARHGNRQDFVDPSWRQTAERPGDPGLSEDGLQQAQELAQYLQHQPIDHIFASPFLRTVQTAAPLAERLSLPLNLETGLGEYLSPKFFGAEPERLSLTALKAQFPGINTQYQSLIQPRYPESWAQLLERSRQTVQALVSVYPGNLLLVGHAATVVGATLGLAPEQGDFRVPVACLTELVEQQGYWQICRKGDTRHLTTRSNRLMDWWRFWSRRLLIRFANQKK